MARQRKGRQADSDDIPMVKPTDSAKRGTKKPLIEISEEEQWKMINESGILKKIPKPHQQVLPVEPALFEGEDSEDITFGEEVLNTILYLVPFSFLLIMMDVLIHYQYNKKPTLDDLLGRLTSGVPIMAFFIFYSAAIPSGRFSLRFKSYRELQILLFTISSLSGCRLIHQFNHSNWLTNMKQCPPLAVVWIYSVFMADLGPAALALLTVGGFVWWKELKIIL